MKQTKRTYVSRAASVLLLLSLLLGCSKPAEKKQAEVIDVKEEAAPAKQTPGEPRAGASSVLLARGTSAALVVFPWRDGVKRGEWLSLANLGNDEVTRSLPRVPVADAMATLILDIPPGFYPVDAHAWVRKQVPYSGGKTGVVSFAAGELVVLVVDEAGAEKPPYDRVAINVAERLTWSLDSAPNLQKYVAKVADDARAKKKSGN